MTPIMKHPNNEDRDHSDLQRGEQRVSFYHQVRAQGTLHRNDYTRSEIEATWFTSGEYKRIRQETYLALELAQSRGGIDETQYCKRGLERYQKLTREDKENRRRNAIQGVLDEQELQRQEGIDDKDLLAKIYGELSHKSKVAARLLGMVDGNHNLHQQEQMSQVDKECKPSTVVVQSQQRFASTRFTSC